MIFQTLFCEEIMSVNKRPLKRSIFIGCSVFFILLCLILSILTYRTYTRSLYQSYNERMTDILNYVDAHIDREDLYECVQTKVESEKFIELGHFMDDVMEDLTFTSSTLSTLSAQTRLL